MATADPANSLDILLIGRAGCGKSSTGNKIVGKEIFASSSDTQSTTTNAQFDWGYFEGRVLKVVDCPGLGDTRLDVDVDVKQLSDAIQIAIANNPIGFHAILYIVKFGNKFDHFDVQALHRIKDIVGENFIKNHCILLMTGGDCFETDPGIRKDKLSFNDWVKRQKNENFQKIVKECQQRMILFNNRTEDKKAVQAQMSKLVEMVSSLAEKGKRYTNKEFEKAARKRQELIGKLRNEQENQEFIDRIGILSSRLKSITDDLKDSDNLQKIIQETEILSQKAEKALKKNTKLESTMVLFDLLRDVLEAKEKNQAKDNNERKEMEGKGENDVNDKAKEREDSTKKKMEELDKKYLEVKLNSAYDTSSMSNGLISKLSKWWNGPK